MISRPGILRAQSRAWNDNAWLPPGAMILVCLWFAACSGTAPVPESDPEPWQPSEPYALASDTLSLAETMPDSLPWPDAPPGEVPLAQIEDLYAEAVSLVASGDLDRAQDHLFSLQDLVLAPSPADADSMYVQHRRSLERRVYLLGAIVAEERAFPGVDVNADSVLTASYATLEAMALPDSLVPATGTVLPPLQADLLRWHNSHVQQWIDYFSGRGHHNFQIWLERKATYEPLITSILDEYDLPRELIYLALIESGLSARARSSVGAVGPWQFMPGTAKLQGLRQDWWVDERRDFEKSTRAACRYLTQLYDEFGDWALVLAAYNSGEGRIRRQIALTGHTDYWAHHLPRQTVAYVPKFIAAVKIGEDPEAYGFHAPQVTPLVYDTVPVSDATDLQLIASCANVDPAAVVALNPQLLRRAVPPDAKDYAVHVPTGTGGRTRRELAKVPASQRLTWRRHRVGRGETLSQIASHYGTSVGGIQRANEMGRRTLIHPGDQLLIPMPQELKDRARARAVEAGHYVPPEGYERVSYKVRSGDSLSTIARHLGVSIKHLRKVNNLRGDLIKPGQHLYAYRKGVTG